MFTSDAPEIHSNAFQNTSIDVYYPSYCNNWENVITNNYGGTINWKPMAKLVINKHPINIVVSEGKKASTTVNASGDGLTYTWYVCSPTGTKFTKSSITSATYSYTMTADKSGRKVYCVITDKYGNSVKTDTVTLIMGNTVEIVAQPENVVVPNGKKASITLNVTGDGLTYKWYYKNKGASKFSYTSTFTGNTYSTAMSDSRDGRQIYCVITDKYGNSVTTDTVTLIMGNTVEIVEQPENVVVPNGKKASVTVDATGDGLTYKWYYKNKGASKFSYTSTFTGNTYSTAMSDSRDGRQIYCVITDKYGNSVTTDTVTLTQK
jgi:3D (Asp-Asp-Asp) domain-containing protein